MVTENLLESVIKNHIQSIGLKISNEELRSLISIELQNRSLKYLQENLLNRSTAELQSILTCIHESQNGTESTLFSKSNGKIKGKLKNDLKSFKHDADIPNEKK